MAKAKGYCIFHYDRVRFTGSTGNPAPIERERRDGVCSVEGCANPRRGDGLCITHYARRRRTGEIGAAELLRGKMGDGSIKDNGYRLIAVNKRQVFEHRYVMEQKLGRTLVAGEQVHHLDGDRLNNKPDNLELWARYQPSGQRIRDKIASAVTLLRQYPEFARDAGYLLVALEGQESTSLLGKVKDEVFTVSEAVCGLMAM